MTEAGWQVSQGVQNSYGRSSREHIGVMMNKAGQSSHTPSRGRDPRLSVRKLNGQVEARLARQRVDNKHMPEGTEGMLIQLSKNHEKNEKVTA